MAAAQWAKEEWTAMRRRLEKLSLAELCEIVTRLGITFTVGNENITDPDEFVLVLDEADRPRLETEYQRIISSRNRTHRREAA